MVAVIAAQAMTAESGGAATCDRRQYLAVLSAKPLAASDKEAFPGGANQIGHLQRRPFHLRCLGIVFVG